jgi:hypothetical protein
MDVTEHDCSQRRTSIELGGESPRRDPQGGSCTLHNGAHRCEVRAQRKRNSHGAFGTDQTDLQPWPAAQLSQQRNEPAGRKIEIANAPVLPAKNRSESQLYPLRSGNQPATLRTGQGRKQQIPAIGDTLGAPGRAYPPATYRIAHAAIERACVWNFRAPHRIGASRCARELC